MNGKSLVFRCPVEGCTKKATTLSAILQHAGAMHRGVTRDEAKLAIWEDRKIRAPSFRIVPAPVARKRSTIFGVRKEIVGLLIALAAVCFLLAIAANASPPDWKGRCPGPYWCPNPHGAGCVPCRPRQPTS